MANDALGPRGSGGGRGRRREPAPPWTYDALLRELADEATYPRLYRIAWTPPAGGSGDGGPGGPPSEREEFLFGIDRILDGIQAYMDRAGRATLADSAGPSQDQCGIARSAGTSVSLGWESATTSTDRSM